MSSSSSSSRSQTRTTVGIPSTCWCGANLTTFGAQTKDNLYRRFYRCKIAVKISQLQADFQSFKRTTTLRLQEHGKKIDESLLEMKRIFHDQTILLDELRNKSTLVLEAKSQSPLLNIAAAAIVLGTMAWLYAKIIVG
ncbi:hypothetical protein YC2023_053291 [Brassica napus]